MTPELTDRIVKVCERIGWYAQGNEMLTYNAKFSGWHWRICPPGDGSPSSYLRSEDTTVAQFVVETYLRQWLESKWEQVAHVTRGGEHILMLGYYTRPKPEIELKNNDYLDLLLTAVEKTLEQEAKP